MTNVVMFPRMFCVYLITNRVSGKLYVGRTKQTLKKRWRQHVHDAFKVTPRRNYRSPLHDAIRKYGADAFSIEMVESCATERASCDAEVKWIAHYRTTDSRVGYNASTGGEGSNGFVMRESHKASIRAALKGKSQSADLVEKRAASKIGVPVAEYRERIARGEKHCSGAKVSPPHWSPRSVFSYGNYCDACGRAARIARKRAA